MIPFAAYTAAETHTVFEWAGHPKIASFHCGYRPLSNAWFVGPTQVSPPNRISIGSAVFFRAHERDQQTNIQTDHATLSVAIGRIHFCDAA